jgi:LTXXQ motif family protein
MKRLIATALMLAATTAAACAQAPAAGDPHHPPQTAAPAQAAPGQPGMGGSQGMMGDMPMMSMMHDMMREMMRDMPMMNMMRMMRSMGMMGPGTAGAMATIERVEGRIAFLRAELKISEAQASAWNAFADALRANAQKLGQVRAAMMPQPGSTTPQVPTLVERLDLQERWLAARLEGIRAIKAAFTTLYATLSDDQKKTAGELLAPHMGMMGTMGMMRGQMRPGPMQPGQMPQPPR